MNDQDNKPATQEIDGFGIPKFLEKKPEVKAGADVGKEAPAEASQQN